MAKKNFMALANFTHGVGQVHTWVKKGDVVMLDEQEAAELVKAGLVEVHSAKPVEAPVEVPSQSEVPPPAEEGEDEAEEKSSKKSKRR